MRKGGYMKSTNIISVIAIVLSAVAIGLSSVGGSGETHNEISEADIRNIVREELVQFNNSSKGSSIESLVSEKKNSGQSQKSKSSANRKVKSLVANEVQDQLQGLVQSGEINTLGVVKFNQHERVDVSHLETTEEKVKFILAKFQNLNSFSHDSEVVEQLREFGDEAIPFLLAGKKGGGGHWGPGWAATQALSKMLNEDHKDIILENFKKSSDFPELILKYNFPEAEELVFNKIKSNKDYIDENIIEAALDYDAVRAEEDIRDYIARGNYVASAAEALLARDASIDIKNELKLAALNCEESWQKAQLSGVLIGQGLKEGLGLALDAYEDSENSYSKKESLKMIRKSTDFSGTTAELIQYLRENKDNLDWDEKTRRFK